MYREKRESEVLCPVSVNQYGYFKARERERERACVAQLVQLLFNGIKQWIK